MSPAPRRHWSSLYARPLTRPLARSARPPLPSFLRRLRAACLRRPGVITRVRGSTYGAPEAATRTQYVQCVGPWGQVTLRLWYVEYAGGVRVACTYPTEAQGW